MYYSFRNHICRQAICLFSKMISFKAGSSNTNSAKTDQSEGIKVTKPKEPPHKGYLEDIRVTLPSAMIDEAGKN